MYQYGENVISSVREVMHAVRLDLVVLSKKPPYGGGVRRP